MLPTSTPAQTGGRMRGRQRGSRSPKATHPLAPTSAGSQLSPRAPLQGRGLSPAHPAEIREGKERAGQEAVPQDGQGLSEEGAAGRPGRAGYLGELVDLLETLLYLQPPAVARDAVHHRHHRLLHHLAADEALQHLGNLQPLCSILLPKLLHLGSRAPCGSAPPPSCARPGPLRGWGSLGDAVSPPPAPHCLA